MITVSLMIQHVHNYMYQESTWCELSVTVSSKQFASVTICTISSNCHRILASIIVNGLNPVA